MTNSTSPARGLAGETDEGSGARALRVVAVAVAHGGLIAWLATGEPAVAPARPEPIRMEVRTIAAPARVEAPAPVQPPVPPKPATALAQPKAPRAPVARPVRAPAKPVLEPVLATAPQPAVESFAAAAAVATAPIAQPTPAAPVAAAAPAALVAARFDADYLNNPAPAYPLMSRRRGEQGTVMLRVQVSAEGAAQHVEVNQSCGYPRLDEAALKAVRAWRFVPARRGNEAVSANVLVPIVFALDV